MASAIPGAGIVGWIADALSEGASQRSTMKLLRDGGYKFSDGKFRSLWGEVRNSMGRIEQVQTISSNSLPRDEDYTPWSTLKGRGFATHIQYGRREKGITDTLMADFVHITDEPHSPDEALQALYDRMSEPDDAEEPYEFEILGALVTGLYKMVPL